MNPAKPWYLPPRRRSVIHQRLALLVSPNTVRVDETVLYSVLVGKQSWRRVSSVPSRRLFPRICWSQSNQILTVHHFRHDLLGLVSFAAHHLASRPGELTLESIITLTSCEWNQLWESGNPVSLDLPWRTARYHAKPLKKRGRLTLIPVTDDQHLVVVRCKLDMTVALLLDCIQRSDLIFPSVPAPYQPPSSSTWPLMLQKGV